jgi:hypothetical protein
MSYEYEIFISYRKVFPIKEWVYEHLLPFIRPYLESELNTRIRIFIDQSQIEQGDIWPARIKRALANSKCLIAVWSPNYFQSQWCMNEYKVMRYREKRLGYGTAENPSGLILPLKVFDGQYFPQDALDIECLDCRDYLRIGEGYRYTPRYIEFQDLLLRWATSAAHAIENAPRWSEEWLTKEWLDDIIGDSHQAIPMTFECPRME